MRTKLMFTMAAIFLIAAPTFHQDHFASSIASAQEVTADAGVGPVTTPPAPPRDVGGVIVSLINAAKAGQWYLVMGLVASLLMMGLKLFAPQLKNNDRWSALVAVGIGILGTLATALIGGAKFDLALVIGALVTGVVSAGGYAVIKKIIWPSTPAPTPTPAPPT